MVDIAVLVSVVVGTAVLAYLIRRWGTRQRRFWETLWLAFFGLFLVISMVAHSLDVLSRLAIGTSYAGEPFPYNFRVYSLLLLGAVLIALGLQLLQQVRGFARWNAAARSNALRTTCLVLAVSVPLLPVHAFFAVIITTLAVLSVLVLAGAKRERPIPVQTAAVER